MPTLTEFIDKYGVDKDAVARIRQRLFLVGRFNQKKKGKTRPERFLFSGNPEKSKEQYTDEYCKKHFTSVSALNYDSFVSTLKPALAERLDLEGQDEETGIPKIKQFVPRNHLEADEGTAVVDLFDYLFLRGVLTTTQPDIAKYRPRLPKGIEKVGSLYDGPEHPGEGIFKLIRHSLETFSTFQPETYKIIEAFSVLLGLCGGTGPLPAYAGGGALPGGFPEKLIDFVYLEKADARFSMDGLDLSVFPWNKLQPKTKAEQAFCNVVVAFRDALLGLPAQNFGTRLYGGRTLNYQASHLFGEDEETVYREEVADADRNAREKRRELAEHFRLSREAYNRLRQILRSKALLSMVLDWVLARYYKLDGIPAGPRLDTKADQRDEAVGLAIVQRDANNEPLHRNDVAEPILRPTTEERDKFKSALAENLEKLVNVLVSQSDDAATAEIAQLPASITVIAGQLRANKDLVKVISGFTTPIGGADTRQAFLDAARMVLFDVLCPVLFEDPAVSPEMLRRFFRQETVRAYLTAIFLSKSNKDAVVFMGLENLKYFKESINKKTQLFTNVEETAGYFIGKFMNCIASEKIRKQLIQGLRVLREAQTILENASVDSVAQLVGLSPHPDEIEAEDEATSRMLEATPIPIKAELVSDPVKKIARTFVLAHPKMREAIKAAAKPIPSGSSQQGADDSKPVANASAQQTVTLLEPEPEELEAQDEDLGAFVKNLLGSPEDGAAAVDTKIEEEVSKEVTPLVDAFFASRNPSSDKIQATQITKLSSDAAEKLLKNDAFMQYMREDVRAFNQILFLIYKRYVDNKGSKQEEFRNSVERLTLINMMLLHQKELDLGTAASNLYQLLIDLVQHVDGENPDLSKFIKNISLTRYFDEKKLKKTGVRSGITNLREVLRTQAFENLEETKSFISELWGVRYLMESLAGLEDVELIVINANAEEFLNWLNSENLTQRGLGNLRSEQLRVGVSHRSIQPGLILMTDSAFSDDYPKASFLDALSATSRSRIKTNYNLLIPPICLSTTYHEGNTWHTDGNALAALASNAAAPVLIVGPSPYLNDADDYFRTYLQAGYVFALHFLTGKTQRLTIDSIGVPDETGRFRVIGRGTDVTIDTTLNRVLWPNNPKDQYGFAADYYLYTILTILAAAHGSKSVSTADGTQYYRNFWRFRGDPTLWEKCIELDPYLMDGTTHLQFSFGDPLISRRVGAALPRQGGAQPNAQAGAQPAGMPDLTSLSVDVQNIARDRTSLKDFNWFNAARALADLD